MTLAQLEQNKLFALCTEKEQKFLKTYLKSGDMSLSISSAYSVEGKSATSLARKLQKKETICALLDYIDGEEIPTKESLTKLVWRTIRHSKNEFLIVKGASLISDLEGYVKKETPEEERLRRIKEAKEKDFEFQQSLRATQGNAADSGQSGAPTVQ